MRARSGNCGHHSHRHSAQQGQESAAPVGQEPLERGHLRDEPQAEDGDQREDEERHEQQPLLVASRLDDALKQAHHIVRVDGRGVHCVAPFDYLNLSSRCGGSSTSAVTSATTAEKFRK